MLYLLVPIGKLAHRQLSSIVRLQIALESLAHIQMMTLLVLVVDAPASRGSRPAIARRCPVYVDVVPPCRFLSRPLTRRRVCSWSWVVTGARGSGPPACASGRAQSSATAGAVCIDMVPRLIFSCAFLIVIVWISTD